MIIDPMWFYWASACDGARAFLITVGVVMALVIAMGTVIYCVSNEEPPKRWMLVCLIVGVALIMAGLFVPTKNTMIEMMAASLATTDNVNSVIEGLKGFVDYVVEVLG